MSELAELTCPACSFREVCGPGEMIAWLRRAKLVRATTLPEVELLPELFRVSSARLTCPQCGRLGLVASVPAPENDEDWGMARKCRDCNRPIARERLEALPDVQVCVECQGRADRGQPEGEEFCPRCGNRMVLAPSRGAGVTRYVVSCPQCRTRGR